MEESDRQLIVKNILHAGTKSVDFLPGSKVFFHFRTMKLDGAVVDDSKKIGRPMELVLGKKFKLEVWEAIVQKMSLNEISKFRVDKSLVSSYPFVSKTLREFGKPKNEKINSHCCGVTLQNEGIGYPDLNDLIKNCEDLEFIIELIEVVPPSGYEKESWQMTEDEKLKNVPLLKEKGNEKFRDKNYEGAAENYATAIGMLEQLMLSEKPHDEDWTTLNRMKIPLLLNFAQCKLLKKEYYAVIEHCTSVLKIDPDNVKALYRRGKAHVGAWNEKEALEDLRRVVELDPTLKSTVENEIQTFFSAIKDKETAQKKNLSQMFS
ncbi:AH receptor-interacting protein [Fopius arisanus]|uniref:AH receptor-interacting protein n=1 Tax=Fopius arisanus TaxID=64838 RepID=A0A9R1THE1_9HYME|nr:PREDICTED: AH receptor-interacting protein [Fopius arisanus]